MVHKLTSVDQFTPLYIGADPGVSGGIAILQEDGALHDLIPMPETERDILDYFLQYQDWEAPVTVRLEKLWGRPGMGGASMFKLGANVGALRIAVMAAGLRLDEVTPQKWMKEFQLVREKGVGQTEWKNVLKGLAQKLFPKTKVTLKTADALLIAESTRRQFRQASAIAA